MSVGRVREGDLISQVFAEISFVGGWTSEIADALGLEKQKVASALHELFSSKRCDRVRMCRESVHGEPVTKEFFYFLPGQPPSWIRQKKLTKHRRGQVTGHIFGRQYRWEL